MTPTVIFIVTTGISLLAVITTVIMQLVRRRRLATRSLLERVQQLERRQLAAANTTQDLQAELAQLKSTLTHNQRLLITGLTRTGRLPDSTTRTSTSRDERKLRGLLPQE